VISVKKYKQPLGCCILALAVYNDADLVCCVVLCCGVLCCVVVWCVVLWCVVVCCGVAAHPQNIKPPSLVSQQLPHHPERLSSTRRFISPIPSYGAHASSPVHNDVWIPWNIGSMPIVHHVDGAVRHVSVRSQGGSATS
jgi:hypothetical protein